MTGGSRGEYDVQRVEATIVDAWDFSDAALSRRRFLAIIEPLPSEDPEALVFTTQVARTHTLGGEPEQAHALLDLTQTQAEDLRPSVSRDHVQARIAIERGRACNSTGSWAAAAPLFDAAGELATSAGAAGLVIDALHMRAIVAGSLEGPAAAMALNERALDAAESSEDPAARRWRAPLLNNLGWDLHELGRHVEALALFERAVPLREQAGQEPELTIARWTVGRELRSLGRVDEGLAVQDELARTRVGAENGFVHEERAECLLELGRREEAGPAFGRAYDLLSRNARLVEHDGGRLARLRDLAGQTSAREAP